MSKNATISTRPPESIAATTIATAEIAAEVLEMANYALTIHSQTVIDVGDDIAFPLGVGDIDVRYYFPVWVDEDVQEFKLEADAVGITGSDEFAVGVSIDATVAWTPNLTLANFRDSVVFTVAHPSTGFTQAEHVVATIMLKRVSGTASAPTLRWARVSTVPVPVADVPSPSFV